MSTAQSTPHVLIVAVLAAAVLAAAAAVTGLWVRRRTTTRCTSELRSIRQAAYRDPLTGLGNRAAFHRLMAQPHSRRSTVILVNIDDHRRHLRAVGERAFDEAITLIAGRIRYEAAIAGAHAFRLRRDEFAVVVRAAGEQHDAAHRHGSPASSDDGAGDLAGRLVAAVPAATGTTGGPAIVRMRARAGIATAAGHDEPDGRLVLAHADIALRSAKRGNAAWARHFAVPSQ
ncbi:GGDEF domain-containing protein [Dactylosporangium sp. NPDC005555]|uniref:GGDEF domain-containing protein n=1 Tax=Dactylosporangium sp. NPDC005555 TaxID=3154889 RepID=UPI0033B4DB9E